MLRLVELSRARVVRSEALEGLFEPACRPNSVETFGAVTRLGMGKQFAPFIGLLYHLHDSALSSSERGGLSWCLGGCRTD